MSSIALYSAFPTNQINASNTTRIITKMGKKCFFKRICCLQYFLIDQNISRKHLS